MDYTKKEQLQRTAVLALIGREEPYRCHRCHNGPGDPGCGKTIHLILDDAFMDACQAAGLPEEEAIRMCESDEE